VFHVYGRRTRIGLLILLVLTALSAAGVLFLKYKLEDLRKSAQAQIESRVGARLSAESIQVNGLRGLRIDGLHAAVTLPAGPVVTVQVPEAYVYIDMIELIYGKVRLQRIQIDGAVIDITRPEDGHWFASGAKTSVEHAGSVAGNAVPSGGFPGKFPFRVVGKGCRLNIRNMAGNTSLSLGDLAFDVSRLPDGRDISARVSALFNGQADKHINMTVRMHSLDDFDLRVQCAELSADDVNLFLPARRRFLVDGAAAPALRVSGYPETLIVSLEMPFHDVMVRDQPELFLPATGHLTALANYDLHRYELALVTARARTNQLSGRVEGTVSFMGDTPVFDLHLEADQIPVQDLLAYALAERGVAFGDIAVNLAEPWEFGVTLEGTPETPVIGVNGTVNGATLAFTPADPMLPAANLNFGLMKFTWNAPAALPEGVLTLSGGTISHAETGLAAENVRGNLNLKEGRIVIEPLQAAITGRPFTGRAEYLLGEEEFTFSVNGGITAFENLRILNDIEQFDLAGDVQLHCDGVITAEKVEANAHLDLTPARVDFEWWFRKPAGIGAGIRNLKLEMTPKKKMTVTAEADIDTSHLEGAFYFTWDGARWRRDRVEVKSDRIDIVSAGKCLRIPYAASGGTGTDAHFLLEPVPGQDKRDVYTVSASLDDAAFLPAGCEAPIACRNVRVEVVMDESQVPYQGTVTVDAAEADIPPLGNDWLLPLEPEDHVSDDPNPRHWTVHLKAGSLSMPPWEGTAFSGEAFDTESESGLRSFAAKIGAGSLEGTFSSQPEDNMMYLNASWQDIPAVYLLRHLAFPEILNGVMSGEVEYQIDKDDPATLAGAGFFDIQDGQFSADVIAQQLAEQLKDDTAALPPLLNFSRFRSNVKLKGDRVDTEKLLLKTSGIAVTGEGFFITEGDMDYTLNISISPETAVQMPMVRQYLNVDGHKLTQNNIELALNIHGPTFNPSSKVVGTPSVGVTLVSGAAEVTNEAIKIIDTPRQILMDLLKIGGGIVGAGRQNGQ
jgi:hypothetical protein